MGLRVDSLTINEWLQTDQQFLYAARTALNAYRQGQAARRDTDKRKAAG